MTPAGTLLRLGRVSNLPTVWSNVLAATALAGGSVWSGDTALVLLAMTLFYLGGMYLNDAFDQDIDRIERPSRPIPAGEIPAAAVFVTGGLMLVAGVVLMAQFGWKAALAGLLLAGTILYYDKDHKGNRLSPVVMGLCRALVYAGAALVAAGALSGAVIIGALALLAHVVGLTYAAKQESLDRIDRLWPLFVLALPLLAYLPALGAGALGMATWLALAVVNIFAVRMLARRTKPGAVPRAVGVLIAAISLLDALIAASVGAASVAVACVAAYVLTRLLHRLVPGT